VPPSDLKNKHSTHTPELHSAQAKPKRQSFPNLGSAEIVGDSRPGGRVWEGRWKPFARCRESCLPGTVPVVERLSELANEKNPVDTKNPVWTSKSESAKKRASERTFAQKPPITFPYRGLYQGPENLPTLLVVPKGTESPKTVCRSHSNPFLQSKVPQTVFWVPKNGIFHKSLLRCGTSAVV
jgi:hypothetical protein